MAEISRNYMAPRAADSIYQEVARFAKFRRGGQTVDGYIAEYDLLQRKAGPKMMMGAGAPEQFASILRMVNSGLPRQGESLESASSQKSYKFVGAPANMLAKMSWVRRMRIGPWDALEIKRRA